MNRNGRRFAHRGLCLLLWAFYAGCSAAEPSVASAARSGQLAISTGVEDIENRHPEVVRVTTSLDGKTKGRFIIDPSACAAKATVKTVL